MQARRELLSKLTLSNKAIWDREHAREQIKSPLVIKVRRLVVLHYPIIHTRGNGNALGQGAQELKVTKLLLGDLEKAIFHLRAAVSSKESWADSRFYLAYALVKSQTDLDEGLCKLNEALRIPEYRTLIGYMFPLPTPQPPTVTHRLLTLDSFRKGDMDVLYATLLKAKTLQSSGDVKQSQTVLNDLIAGIPDLLCWCHFVICC